MAKRDCLITDIYCLVPSMLNKLKLKKIKLTAYDFFEIGRCLNQLDNKGVTGTPCINVAKVFDLYGYKVDDDEIGFVIEDGEWEGRVNGRG